MYDTGNDGNHRNVAKVQQFQKLGWSQIPRSRATGHDLASL